MDNYLFVSTVDKAGRLIQQVSTHLPNRNFNVTKWITNNESLLQMMPEANRA